MEIRNQQVIGSIPIVGSNVSGSLITCYSLGGAFILKADSAPGFHWGSNLRTRGELSPALDCRVRLAPLKATIPRSRCTRRAACPTGGLLCFGLMNGRECFTFIREGSHDRQRPPGAGESAAPSRVQFQLGLEVGTSGGPDGRVRGGDEVQEPVNLIGEGWSRCQCDRGSLARLAAQNAAKPEGAFWPALERFPRAAVVLCQSTAGASGAPALGRRRNAGSRQR
jgi:hypothetical protein